MAGAQMISSVHQTLDMLKHRITLVASPAGGGVSVGAEHERVRAIHAGKPQLAHRLRDCARIILHVGGSVMVGLLVP